MTRSSAQEREHTDLRENLEVSSLLSEFLEQERKGVQLDGWY